MWTWNTSIPIGYTLWQTVTVCANTQYNLGFWSVNLQPGPSCDLFICFDEDCAPVGATSNPGNIYNPNFVYFSRQYQGSSQPLTFNVGVKVSNCVALVEIDDVSFNATSSSIVPSNNVCSSAVLPAAASSTTVAPSAATSSPPDICSNYDNVLSNPGFEDIVEVSPYDQIAPWVMNGINHMVPLIMTYDPHSGSNEM